MQNYTIVSVLVILITTTALVLILNKKKILNTSYLMGIILSMLTAMSMSILFPIAVGTIIRAFTVELILAIGAIFLIYLTIVIFFILLIASFIPKDIKKKKAHNKNADNKAEKKPVDKLDERNSEKKSFKKTKSKTHDMPEEKDGKQGQEPEEGIHHGKGMLKEIFNHRLIKPEAAEEKTQEISDGTTENADKVEISGDSEKKSEKYVDTQPNIDTMGIEQNNNNSDNEKKEVIENKSFKEITPTVLAQDYIDEAFLRKQQGKPLEAITWYLKALGERPDKSLTFWIVLDICALYKQLGQIELAKDILNSYLAQYGDIMDASTRRQIEENLAS